MVEIRDGRPSLRDYAAWLRRMADNLEVEGAKHEIRTVLLVTEHEDGDIDVACFGENPPAHHTTGLLFTAATQNASRATE